MGNSKHPELDKTQLAQKIGQRIKAMRSRININQAELARRCGKDSQHIELIENGKVSATIYTLYIVARALDSTLDELLKLD